MWCKEEPQDNQASYSTYPCDTYIALAFPNNKLSWRKTNEYTSISRVDCDSSALGVLCGSSTTRYRNKKAVVSDDYCYASTAFFSFN